MYTIRYCRKVTIRIIFAFVFISFIYLQSDISDNLYYDDIIKTNRSPEDVKFILLWSMSDFAPFTYLGHGQKAFIENNCPSINCYVTDNKKFFGGNLTGFDAIAFNGRDKKSHHPEYFLPQERSPHQKYIYCNSESAQNYPIKNKIYNGYFNWTATYRLDSEIIINYFYIMTMDGDVVGPKLDMKWLDEMDNINDTSSNIKLKCKKYAAAWFVSHCKSLSFREVLVLELQKELAKYRLDIHTYGNCGNHKCPRSLQAKCNSILEKDYYFYLAFENAIDKDYVTEKLLTAVKNDVVPIVYGGANYSRFLPPGSYINAREMSVQKLASLMDRLIKNPKLYRKYFWWKRYYTYIPAKNEFVCALCSSLNGKKFEEYSSYDDFLLWWNPND